MTLQPFFLLRDQVTLVRATKRDDGHGGQQDQIFTDVATVPGRFYMTSGGDPQIDAATGKILTPKRGEVWIHAGKLPVGVALPVQGDRIRLADGTVYAVLYSAKQGQIAHITLGEIVA